MQFFEFLEKFFVCIFFGDEKQYHVSQYLIDTMMRLIPRVLSFHHTYTPSFMKLIGHKKRFLSAQYGACGWASDNIPP